LKINRSEIYSFEKIKELNNKKSNLKFTSITPKITAFAKLGYGNPNSLNMFEQSWSEFYMLGVKFSWKPFAWFNESQNEEMTSVLNDNLEIEKSEFLKQINTQLEMEYSELSKIELLIEQDLIIIDLQKRIKVEKYNQFLNGTATIHDYITEFNALQIYETNLELHKIMYENVKNNILIKSGNFVGN
jgi:hypothetical protein